MRMWSFHPMYLDKVGLSRAINEGISGYKALTKQQKMWQNHSQLTRFKNTIFPSDNLRNYLLTLIDYKRKEQLREIDYVVNMWDCDNKMTVTKGQIRYEWQSYLEKLEKRNKKLYDTLRNQKIDNIVPHPLFIIVDGAIESWEKVKQK